MNLLGHLSAKDFYSLWERNLRKCEVRSAPPEYKHVLREALYKNQSEGINYAIEAAQFWHSKRTEFFAKFPYKWLFSPQSFDFATEAAFQVRTLELIFPIWDRRIEYRLDDGFFGDIAVRFIVVPKTFGATPRASSIENHGFILMPSGWFDALNRTVEATRFLQTGDRDTARSIIMGGICAKVSEYAINLVDNDVSSPTAERIIISHATSVVAKGLSNQHKAFSDSLHHLDADTCLPGLWGDLVYGACTFALAHEVSHVLTGEHLKNASAADEERADDIAFDMTALCQAWQARCTASSIKSSIGKTCFAIIPFLFANSFQIEDQILRGRAALQGEAFRRRALRLQTTAGAQTFPTSERDDLNSLTDLFLQTKSLQREIIEEIYPKISLYCETGRALYLEFLRQQSVIGGIIGI